MSDAPPNPVESPPRRRWPIIDLLCLLVLAMVAIGVRVACVDADPSFDELWHLGLTAGNGSPMDQFTPDTVYVNPPSWTRLEGAAPIVNVWSGMDGVLHPPLYILTLRLWRECFGTSDLVAHAYSMFWSVIAIGFLYDIARRSMDRVAGVLVALAMCVSQTQVYFAQEIRGYEMMIGLGTIGLWLMTRLELETRRRWWVVTLAWLTLPLLLTHYFAAGAALGMAVWGVLRLKGDRLRFTAHLMAAGLVYAAIWVPFAIWQMDDLGTGDAFLHVAHFDGVAELMFLCATPFRLIVDRDFDTEPFMLGSGVLLVLPWLLVRRLRPLLPWVLCLVSVLLTLAALDVIRSTRHLALIRYAAIASPAVFLLAAGCVWTIHRRLTYVVAAAIAFFGAIYLYSANGIFGDSADFSRSVRLVATRIQPDEAILLYHGGGPLFTDEVLAMTTSHRVDLKRVPFVKLGSALTPELRARLPRRVWLITGNLPGDLQDVLPGSRQIRFERVDLELSIYHVELEPDPNDAKKE